MGEELENDQQAEFDPWEDIEYLEFGPAGETYGFFTRNGEKFYRRMPVPMNEDAKRSFREAHAQPQKEEYKATMQTVRDIESQIVHAYVYVLDKDRADNYIQSYKGKDADKDAYMLAMNDTFAYINTKHAQHLSPSQEDLFNKAVQIAAISNAEKREEALDTITYPLLSTPQE